MHYDAVNGVTTTVPAGKPGEHLNEISIAFGGHIPQTRFKPTLSKKLFFFGNWDEFHGRNAATPSLFTIPTTLMRQGNFTELGSDAHIYNPLTNTCASSTSCSRTAFAYGGTTNVIDPSYISSISQYEQSFLPSPSLSTTVNINIASVAPVSKADVVYSLFGHQLQALVAIFFGALMIQIKAQNEFFIRRYFYLECLL